MSLFSSGIARAALACAGLSIAGCGSGEQQAATPERPALRVEYAGCRTVLTGEGTGPVCVPGTSRELRLWIQPPVGAEIEISADGARLESPGVVVGSGWRFTVEIPTDASRLAVRSGESKDEAPWTLELAEPGDAAWLDEALSLGIAGERQAARQLLEKKMVTASEADKGVALSILVRLALADGANSEAAELLADSIATHRATGRLLDMIRDSTVVVFNDIQNRRFADARARLHELAPPTDSPAEASSWIANFRGMLAGSVGDYRTAIVDLQAAAAQAERVGLTRERWDAEQALAYNLQSLGRSQEAAQLFARLRPERQHIGPQQWAQLLSNQAWSLLLAREAGETAEDPTDLLQEALDIYTEGGRPDQLVNVWINLALAHLQNSRPADARTALEHAQALRGEATLLQRLWWLEIEARIALDDRQPTAALELYQQLEEMAKHADRPEGRWRAAVGKARAQVALGNSVAAVTALENAEVLLEEESLQVPLHEGRETFVAQREMGTRLYLELLLSTDRPREALTVARRSRARVLRGLRRGNRLALLSPAERDRWYRAIGEYLSLRAAVDVGTDPMLPVDQLTRQGKEKEVQGQAAAQALDRAFAVLGTEVSGSATTFPAPRPGELILTYHPLPTGWVGFAATVKEVVSHRFELPEDAVSHPEQLSALLLEPFRAAIERAERLRLLPYGALREVDLHALPYDGDILLAARPVVYGLDLATLSSPGAETELQALIVADPQENLPAARYEADEVQKALQSLPETWSVELLQGPDADAEKVRRALASVDLLHYSGHGVFAGRGGWESALRLAGNGRLTPGDLLSLERAPRWVVLSGCETARSALAAPAESIGLAHACLLAGTLQVVAAVRPIDDRDAARLFTSLYRRWNTAPDLVLLLREAVLAWRQKHPSGDWASFRVLEP